MEKDFSSEITYKTARSSGSGGQNVNKVETMVEASWYIESSLSFDDDKKKLIKSKLSNRINKNGFLSVRSSETRSQLENKEIAKNKLIELVHKSLIIPKLRKATKIPKSVIEKRLKNKKRISEIKKLRKNDRNNL